MFSFLYRAFYDRTLFSFYVKSGKGYGLKLLIILAFFMALCLAGRVFWLFNSFSPQVIETFISQVPEIVFEKGVITSPDNYRYEDISQSGRFFFVFDTTDSQVNLKELPSIGLYITKDALITVHRNEMRRIPFVNILRKVDFSLNQESLRQAAKEAFSLTKTFLPLFVIVIYFPMFFSALFFMLCFYFILSFVMTQIVKVPLTWEERVRLVALSVMPAGVVNGAEILFHTRIPLEPLSVLIALFYMYCFLKDGQNAVEKA